MEAGDNKPAHLEKVFSNSLFVSLVYDGGKLVGVGRALAGGGDCSYICDIAVLPSHEGTGLGKQLVGDLVERWLRRRVGEVNRGKTLSR